jgi:hypothetical protein
MQLVGTTTVGSGGASSIEFSNIPQSGKHLIILFSGRSDLGGVAGGLTVRYNADSGTNYAWRRLVGDGAAVSVAGNSSQTAITNSFSVNGSIATSITFSNATIYTANYSAAIQKSLLGEAISENNATEAYQVLTAGSWTGTAAITSLTLSLGGSFLQNTTASLYIIS